MTKLSLHTLLFGILCLLCCTIVVQGRTFSGFRVNPPDGACRTLGSVVPSSSPSGYVTALSFAKCCDECSQGLLGECTAFSFYSDSVGCYIYNSSELEWIPNPQAESGTPSYST